MTTKFSQFNNGGPLAPGDQVVGLRGGVNFRFAAPAIPVLGWTVIAVNQMLVVDNGYFADNAIPATYTLPLVANVGDTIEIINTGPSTFTIAQNAGQQIRIGGALSTAGIAGSISCTATGDSITLVCKTANTLFVNLNAPEGIWVTV